MPVVKQFSIIMIFCSLKQRQFTRWSKQDSEAVKNYFSSWISSTGLPGKSDILKFKEQNESMKYDWTTIRNKVVNEKMAYEKRKKLRLESLKF